MSFACGVGVALCDVEVVAGDITVVGCGISVGLADIGVALRLFRYLVEERS